MKNQNQELGKMMKKIPGVTTSAFTGKKGNEHDILDIINRFKDAFQNNMDVCADFKNCLSENKRICAKSCPCCKINNEHANATEIMFLDFNEPNKINLEYISIKNDSIIKKMIEEHLKVPK
jgi:hypothetical protein